MNWSTIRRSKSSGAWVKRFQASIGDVYTSGLKPHFCRDKPQHHRHGGFVIDDHDALAGAAIFGIHRRLGDRQIGGRHGGEINGKRGADADAGFDRDAAAMGGDDVAHDRKSQAGAHAGLFRGEKRLEDSFAYRLIHAATGIRKRDTRILAWLVVWEKRGGRKIKDLEFSSKVNCDVVTSYSQ